MRKLPLLLVGALVALASPTQAQVVGGQQIVCNQTFQVSQGAVALTKIISGIAGRTISICGWAASAGAAAGTFSISYGTGTNCATGTVTVVPIMNLAINSTDNDHVPVANIAIPTVNASGVPIDVCLVTTGTGPTSILIYYFQ